MDLARSATRGSFLLLSGQGARVAIQFVGLIILARLLQPSDFGIYAMVLVFSGVAVLISDFGLSLANLQGGDLPEQVQSNLFWSALGLGTLVASALFFAAPVVAEFYDEDAVADVLRVMAIVSVGSALASQYRANHARKFRHGVIALSEVASQLVGVLAAVALAVLGMGYWALVGQQIAVILVMSGVLAGHSPWMPTRPRRTESMRRLYAVAGSGGGVQLLNYLTANFDTLLLGRLAGASSAGLYAQGFQLTRTPLTQLASPLTQVTVPVLVRARALDRYGAYFSILQTLSTYGLGLGLALLAGLSSPLSEVLLGDSWDGIGPIVSVLAVGAYFQVLGYLYFWAFLAESLTARQFRVSVLTRPIMLIIMLLVAPLGPVAMAAGVGLGLCINWLALTIFVLPRSSLSFRSTVSAAARPVPVIAAVAICPHLALMYFKVEGPICELLVGALAAVAVVAVSLLFPWIRNDLRSVRRVPELLRSN